MQTVNIDFTHAFTVFSNPYSLEVFITKDTHELHITRSRDGGCQPIGEPIPLHPDRHRAAEEAMRVKEIMDDEGLDVEEAIELKDDL